MPAKPLTPEQKADALRLKNAFNAFKDRRRANGEPCTQDALSGELALTQSAISQYINGIIPLNADALTRFCRLMVEKPESISPAIYAAVVQKSMELVDPGSAKEVDMSKAVPPRGVLSPDIIAALSSAGPTERAQIEGTLRMMLGIPQSKLSRA